MKVLILRMIVILKAIELEELRKLFLLLRSSHSLDDRVILTSCLAKPI